MTAHSKLVQTRRRKQRAKKDLALQAKRAKKLAGKSRTAAGAPKSA